ncbi:MAG: SUMF1/EgtB/PvdO family nonheme iron enzyme [Bacteroidota bacterium]
MQYMQLPGWQVSQRISNDSVIYCVRLALHLFDGNVWEWCWDWYGSTYPSGGTSDPKGPTTSQTDRVLRGGSFGNVEYLCRFDNRDGNYPYSRDFRSGFRCVQN